MRTALIVGISGLGGKSLLDTLLNNRNYKKITVFTRRDTKRLKNIHLKKVLVDFKEIENFENHFEGIDDVFCLLGTDYIITKDLDDADYFDYEYPYRFAQTAKKAGIKNFYFLNRSMPDAPSGKHALRAKLERDLQLLGFENLIIFKVNSIGKSVNEASSLYVASRGIGSVINLVGFGLFDRFTKTPANLLARKMVEVALKEVNVPKVFYPKDY